MELTSSQGKDKNEIKKCGQKVIGAQEKNKAEERHIGVCVIEEPVHEAGVTGRVMIRA